MLDSTLSHDHYMAHNLPIQYRSKVSNTVSSVVTGISYGMTIVYMKPATCPNRVAESHISSYAG
jgi:hypothetical protein